MFDFCYLKLLELPTFAIDRFPLALNQAWV